MHDIVPDVVYAKLIWHNLCPPRPYNMTGKKISQIITNISM